MWYETTKNELILGQVLCMEGGGKVPKLGKCHEMGGNQDWRHKSSVSFSYFFMNYSRQLISNKKTYVD